MNANAIPAIVHVEVAGNGAGGLEVSWTMIGQGPVEVATGPSPQAIDHDHPVARVEGATQVSLNNLGRGRHYVSVAPAGTGPGVVAAERLVALQAGTNFRDLGGYRTGDGGRVRWAMVFRSAALHRLTAADLATVDLLGLRVVYDLRSEEERETAPSVLPDGVRCERLPIGGTSAKTKALTDDFVQGNLANVPPDFLVRIYEAMAEVSAPAFGRLLTALAEPDGRPALFHCTAGKDRTGMSAALLLSVLGVDEATILDDYELSAAHYTERQMALVRRRLVDHDIDEDHYRALFGAPRHAMASLLAMLRGRHGSIETYLEEEAGVEPAVVAELRAGLVERA